MFLLSFPTVLWVIAAVFGIAGLEEITRAKKGDSPKRDPQRKKVGMTCLVLGLITLAVAIYFQFKNTSLLSFPTVLWLIAAVFGIAGLIMEEVIPVKKDDSPRSDPQYKKVGNIYLILGSIILALALYFQFRSFGLIALCYLIFLFITEFRQKKLPLPEARKKIFRYGDLQLILGLIFTTAGAIWTKNALQDLSQIVSFLGWLTPAACWVIGIIALIIISYILARKYFCHSPSRCNTFF